MTQQQHNPTTTEEQLDDDLPSKLPQGLVLPDDRILTYAPQQNCDCADCTAALEAYKRDELDLQQAVGVVT